MPVDVFPMMESIFPYSKNPSSAIPFASIMFLDKVPVPRQWYAKRVLIVMNPLDGVMYLA